MAAWMDPSSTAIPFAQHAQAARGKGRTMKEKTQRDKGHGLIE